MTVYLDVWTIPSHRIVQALWHMAADPRKLASMPGLRFHKSLGTGAGQRFTAADADLRQWALLTVWDGPDHPARDLRASWDRKSVGHTRFELGTIASHGQWGGSEPFIPDPQLRDWDGPIAAITRARVRNRQWRTFQRAVPPVARTLADREGLLYRIGIGEAPIGLQGTFSVWRDSATLREFAYADPAHVAVIEQTHRSGWYVEELFARFAVLSVTGDQPW